MISPQYALIMNAVFFICDISGSIFHKDSRIDDTRVVSHYNVSSSRLISHSTRSLRSAMLHLVSTLSVDITTINSYKYSLLNN